MIGRIGIVSATAAVLCLAVIAAGCRSYETYNDRTPLRNCVTDRDGNYRLCDLRLILNPRGALLDQNVMRIEEYVYSRQSKTEYRIIVIIQASAYAYYENALFTIDKHSQELAPAAVRRESPAGELLRETLQFTVTKDFIGSLSGAKKISIRMQGGTMKSFTVAPEDLASIGKFLKSL